jgi:hypothetical protein
MPDLFLVFGGAVKDPRGNDFRNTAMLDLVGLFADHASALAAWRGASQRAIDDAETKYVLVRLGNDPTADDTLLAA